MTSDKLSPSQFLSILQQAAKLKTTDRHCYTEADRKESVADHSWRIALMAMLLDGVPEFKDVDMNRVIRMCLIHDLGESFTGDIPTFRKTGDDAKTEDELLHAWVSGFPEPQREEWTGLLHEMEELATREAKLYKALDKLEALISHNESDISTWLPLEYELNLVYGEKEAAFSPYLSGLRAEMRRETEAMIEDAKARGVAPEGV